MKRLVMIASALLLAAAATTASAQDKYPSRTVKIVVPYAPGGAVDVVARKVAQKLTEQTGQAFFVDNKPGATGTIGTQFVARAPADGFTLLAIDNTYSLLPYVFKKLPWNHDTAFAPITVSVFTPVLVAVRADGPFKDLGALLAEARANPDKLTYGTGGPPDAADAAALDAIVARTKGQGYGFRNLVHEIVQSPLFREK